MSLDPTGAIFDPKKHDLRLQIIKPEYKDEPSIKSSYGYAKAKTKSKRGPFFEWNDRDIKAYLMLD